MCSTAVCDWLCGQNCLCMRIYQRHTSVKFSTPLTKITIAQASHILLDHMGTLPRRVMPHCLPAEIVYRRGNPL